MSNSYLRSIWNYAILHKWVASQLTSPPFITIKINGLHKCRIALKFMSNVNSIYNHNNDNHNNGSHKTGGTAGFGTNEIFVIIMHIKKLK